MLTHFVHSHLSSKLPALAWALPSLAWALPSLALMTCAHSLRSFALVIKAPFSRLAISAHFVRTYRSKGLFHRFVLRAASLHHSLTLARVALSFHQIVHSYCLILLFNPIVHQIGFQKESSDILHIQGTSALGCSTLLLQLSCGAQKTRVF